MTCLCWISWLLCLFQTGVANMRTAKRPLGGTTIQHPSNMFEGRSHVSGFKM